MISRSERDVERPVIIASNRFEDYLGATEWLLGRISERHSVYRLSTPQVVGGLIGERDDISGQRLRVIGNSRKGEVIRHYSGMPVAEGVTVSGFPGEAADIVAHVEPLESKLLDRGLSWVRIGIETPSVFHLTVRAEHDLSDVEELATRLSAAERSTTELLEGILRSETTPPHAPDYVDA